MFVVAAEGEEREARHSGERVDNDKEVPSNVAHGTTSTNLEINN